jgi:hypothetical protein
MLSRADPECMFGLWCNRKRVVEGETIDGNVCDGFDAHFIRQCCLPTSKGLLDAVIGLVRARRDTPVSETRLQARLGFLLLVSWMG